MNRCERAAFSRWLLLSLGLLGTAALGTACEATSPALSRIRHDVALLALADGNIRHEAYERLLEDGPAAAPALVAALERKDATYRQKDEIIWCLHRMRALEGVPALVRFSDREGWFLVSDEIVTFPRVADWDKPPSPAGRKHLALLAREAVGMTIDPTGTSTWGAWKISATQSSLGTETYYSVLEERKAYWRKVNSWYDEWRAVYDPEQWLDGSEKAGR